MTKEQKVVVIEEIGRLLDGVKTLYIADISGLNAQQTSDLRRQCFRNDIKLKVVKNTLLKKAMEKVEEIDFSPMFDSFKGNTAVMIAQTSNAPAKLIQTFRVKGDKPLLKSAYVQETFFVGDEHLVSLANIKSKEEVIADIIALLQSPLRNILSGLENKFKKEE